jgi:hypothetical protein
MMIGRKFGRLTVVEWCKTDDSRHKVYRCACSCGGETKVRSTDLIGGHSRSCGCRAAAGDGATVQAMG